MYVYMKLLFNMLLQMQKKINLLKLNILCIIGPYKLKPGADWDHF